MSEPGDDRENLAEGSLISHLLELRDRLLRAVIAVGIVFLPLAFFSNQLFTLVAQPLINKLPADTSIIATSLISPFMAPLKLALMTSLFLAMPYVLYQIWAFVSPGLYRHEKRFAIPLLVSSIVLFYLGVAFAYFVVFPLMFTFLTSTGPDRRTHDDRHVQLPGFRPAALHGIRNRLRDTGRHRAACLDRAWSVSKP